MWPDVWRRSYESSYDLNTLKYTNCFAKVSVMQNWKWLALITVKVNHRHQRGFSYSSVRFGVKETLCTCNILAELLLCRSKRSVLHTAVSTEEFSQQMVLRRVFTSLGQRRVIIWKNKMQHYWGGGGEYSSFLYVLRQFAGQFFNSQLKYRVNTRVLIYWLNAASWWWSWVVYYNRAFIFGLPFINPSLVTHSQVNLVRGSWTLTTIHFYSTYIILGFLFNKALSLFLSYFIVTLWPPIVETPDPWSKYFKLIYYT